MIVPLLACLDLDLQFVSRRRQRAGRVGRERARRILGFVEIEDDLAVHRLLRVEESSGLVSLAPVRAVAEDNEKRSAIILQHRLKRTLFAVEAELQYARAFH